MENNFIKYRKYGFGPVNNLVYSYIVGWGDKGTYASNEHIASELECSYKTIQRALKDLNDKGVIKITNPKGRSRHIIAVQQPGQIVQQLGHNVPVSRTDCPTNQDKLSHNKNSNQNRDKNNHQNSNHTSGQLEVERYNLEFILKNEKLLDDYLKV